MNELERQQKQVRLLLTARQCHHIRAQLYALANDVYDAGADYDGANQRLQGVGDYLNRLAGRLQGDAEAVVAPEPRQTHRTTPRTPSDYGNDITQGYSY